VAYLQTKIFPHYLYDSGGFFFKRFKISKNFSRFARKTFFKTYFQNLFQKAEWHYIGVALPYFFHAPLTLFAPTPHHILTPHTTRTLTAHAAALSESSQV
jgi:hypothetical protein